MSLNVLITGANRGLGLEFTRQYAQAGWQVFACCRQPDKAVELQQLATQQPEKVSLHALDVANFAQIEQLAKQLSADSIDLLLNNAGLYSKGEAFGSIDYEAWMEAFRVNTMAPLKMAEVFAGHVARSQQKKIVNITSKMGSIDDNTSGHHYLYRSSKTALNMVTKSLAIDLASRGITAIVMHPGWVQTDMGGLSAPTTVEQSVSGMRQVVDRLTANDSGKFYGYDGKEILW
jgi:NAD(P)-dependent dehydrogenase (short-subunit alcohol dehydrogenase family)